MSLDDVEASRPPLRGCGCTIIAVAASLLAGSWLLGGVLGDCFGDCPEKSLLSLFGPPALVLASGAAIGWLFLRVTRRR